MASSLKESALIAPRAPAAMPLTASGKPRTDGATRRAVVYGMNGDSRTIDITCCQTVKDVACSIERVFDLRLCSDTETIDIICGATALGWRDYWKRVSETNAWADIPLSYVLRAFTADEQEAREQEQLAAEEEEAEAERAMENLQEMMDGPFFHESWSDTDSDPMGLGLGLASTGGPHL